MSAAAFAIAAIFGLMLAEQRLSQRHEARLKAEGAVCPPGDVYRVLAILYPAAFLAMGAEGLWRASLPAATPASDPSWAASGVLLFAVSKALKYWAIRALGWRWSFRVFVLPGRPLVHDGPYRYISHPNYIAVVGELLGTAMMVGARVSGPVMIALTGIALWRRIRFESRALAAAGAGPGAWTSEEKR